MANSKFRCGACRDYKPQPEYRRLGNVRVCSEQCAADYYRSKSGTSSRSSRGTTSEIPTTVRNRVVVRDRARCRFAGCPAEHVHHINYKSQGVDNQEHNLLCLCRDHHDEVHTNKRYWQPILRALIWLEYVQHQHLTVIQVERRLYGQLTIRPEVKRRG